LSTKEGLSLSLKTTLKDAVPRQAVHTDEGRHESEPSSDGELVVVLSFWDGAVHGRTLLRIVLSGGAVCDDPKIRLCG